MLLGKPPSPSHRHRGWRASTVPLLALVALLAVAAGCANGTYPLDFFYEMHYQQSYQSHEPPRLSPPSAAVPVTGKDLSLLTLTREELLALENPRVGPDGTRQGLETGKRLFQVNCAMCHGSLGEGDGKVLEIMRQDYGYQVKLDPDLTTLGSTTDATLFGIISDRDLVFSGIEGWVMPQFRRLLTDDERWMLVNYIRALQE